MSDNLVRLTLYMLWIFANVITTFVMLEVPSVCNNNMHEVKG